MIGLDDFKRLIRPITNKIFLLIGRAVLKAVENSTETQLIQVVALAEETISDIERFQEYGFDSYPFAEAEVFIGFLNGNRDHGIALKVHDSRYRPTDLAEGEVIVYTDEDVAANKMRIHFKRNRVIDIKCNELNITTDSDCNITVGGDMAVNVTGNHETNAARIDHN